LEDSMENSFHFFPLWKRGMKGDLTAFQKAKLLREVVFRVAPVGARETHQPSFLLDGQAHSRKYLQGTLDQIKIRIRAGLFR